MIYFIKRPDDGQIKIGTSACLSLRLRQLAAEHGDDLVVLAVVDGGREGEGALHRRFAHLRAVGEWFEPGDDLLGFIVAEGQKWDGADNDVPVKMDAEIVRKAKIVASYRGQSLAEFLSDALGAIVDRLIDEEYAKERARKEGGAAELPPARPKRGPKGKGGSK